MKYLITAALLIVLLAPSAAQAAYTCRGTITRVGVRFNSVLVVGLSQRGFTAVGLCALERRTDVTSSLSAEVCRSILALATSAFLAGKTVHLSFRDDSNTCNKGNTLNFTQHFYTLAVLP